MSAAVPQLDDAEFAATLERILGADETRALVDTAEVRGSFPRRLIEVLGREGIFALKSGISGKPDLDRLIFLSEAVGRLGSAGIAVGVSLHHSALAILSRFGKTKLLRDIADDAVAGKVVLCMGASEPEAGSDLLHCMSTATREANGYRLKGQKKFVSLSPIADYALLLVRVPSESEPGANGDIAMFAVPTSQLTVGEPFDKVGARSLDTAPITFDTFAPAAAMIARPGTGLAALSWGLSHERLSIAGHVVGACDLAIGVTVARMMKREQFGTKLIDHQALKLRVADLSARVDVLRWALRGVATDGALNLRVAAALKVTAARLSEEVLSECMHIFGGVGYLPDQSPLGRWWRDAKLARIGGGTDEVQWELVAAGLTPNYEAYDRLVHDEAS
jgi:alkylation response protein AidB-like acyl-CoA dehydrogenase